MDNILVLWTVIEVRMNIDDKVYRNLGSWVMAALGICYWLLMQKRYSSLEKYKYLQLMGLKEQAVNTLFIISR